MGQGLKGSQPGRGGEPGDTGAKSIWGRGIMKKYYVVYMLPPVISGIRWTCPTSASLFPVLGAELPVGRTGRPESLHTLQPKRVGLWEGDLVHPCWDLVS